MERVEKITITPDMRESVILLRRKGFSHSQIAQRTGISQSCISSICADLRSFSFEKQVKALKAKDLDSKGVKHDDICKMLDVTSTTATKYIRAVDNCDDAEFVAKIRKMAQISENESRQVEKEVSNDDVLKKTLTTLQSLMFDYVFNNDYRAVKILAEAAIELQEEKKNETV